MTERVTPNDSDSPEVGLGSLVRVSVVNSGFEGPREDRQGSARPRHAEWHCYEFRLGQSVFLSGKNPPGLDVAFQFASECQQPGSALGVLQALSIPFRGPFITFYYCRPTRG